LGGLAPTTTAAAITTSTATAAAAVGTRVPGSGLVRPVTRTGLALGCRAATVLATASNLRLQHLPGGIPVLERLAGSSDIHRLNPVAVFGRTSGGQSRANLISSLDLSLAGAGFPENEAHLLALPRADHHGIELARVAGTGSGLLHHLNDLALDLPRARCILRENCRAGAYCKKECYGDR
jgi:hypothetical protein